MEITTFLSGSLLPWVMTHWRGVLTTVAASGVLVHCISRVDLLYAPVHRPIWGLMYTFMAGWAFESLLRAYSEDPPCLWEIIGLAATWINLRLTRDFWKTAAPAITERGPLE